MGKKSKSSSPTTFEQAGEGSPARAVRDADAAVDVFGEGSFRTVMQRIGPASQKEPPRKFTKLAAHYKAWILAQQPTSTSCQAPRITSELIEKTKKTPAFDGTRGLKKHEKLKERKFHFTLGAGSVFPAWDASITTMRVGEAAFWVVAPEHAYGEKGVPTCNIPPNAWLLLEVELHEPEAWGIPTVNWFEVFKTVAVAAFVIWYCFWYSPKLIAESEKRESQQAAAALEEQGGDASSLSGGGGPQEDL